MANEEQTTATILRAVLALGRRLRSERPARALSLPALGLLACLHRNTALPAARLAALQQLQPQSLTRLIAALERAGLIVRRRNADDRREILIALTPRGRRVLAAEMAVRRDWLERAIGATLTPAEARALQDVAPVMLKLAEAATARE